MRHGKKQESMAIWRKKGIQYKLSEEAQMLDLLDKDFKLF